MTHTEHFKGLIDLTSFGAVRGNWASSRSLITDVIFVGEEWLLSEVAELLTEEHPTDAQRAQFARWVREGRLKVGKRKSPLHQNGHWDGCMDVDAIADEAPCRVLLLPPYYLVHLCRAINRSSFQDRDPSFQN